MLRPTHISLPGILIVPLLLALCLGIHADSGGCSGIQYNGFCWFMGGEGDSCTDVCDGRGGVDSRCWDDDSSCSVAKQFVTCESCGSFSYWGPSIWYGNQCYFRGVGCPDPDARHADRMPLCACTFSTNTSTPLPQANCSDINGTCKEECNVSEEPFEECLDCPKLHICCVAEKNTVKPDLTVTDIRWSPVNLGVGHVTGTDVSFKAVVENLGEAEACSFNWVLYLDGNQICSVSETSCMSPGEIRTLECGEYNEIRLTVGEHELRAVVDPDDEIDESDDGNNVVTEVMGVGAENCCNEIDDDGDGFENGYDPKCQKDVLLPDLGVNTVCWWTEWDNYGRERYFYSGLFECPPGSFVDKVSIEQYTRRMHAFFYVYDDARNRLWGDSESGDKELDLSSHKVNKIKFCFSSDYGAVSLGVKVNSISCSKNVDLIVENIQLFDGYGGKVTKFEIGETYTVVAEIREQGAGITFPELPDKALTLYIDGMEASSLSYVDLSDIPAGESATYEFKDAWTPETDKQYTLRVEVDASNKIAEVEENNNELSRIISLIPEICCNEIDDDGDELRDSHDPDCQNDVSLNVGINEICCWILYGHTEPGHRSGIFECPPTSIIEEVSVTQDIKEEDDSFRIEVYNSKWDCYGYHSRWGENGDKVVDLSQHTANKILFRLATTGTMGYMHYPVVKVHTITCSPQKPDLIVENIKLFDNGDGVIDPLPGKPCTMKAEIRNQGGSDAVFPDLENEALTLYIDDRKFSTLSYADLSGIPVGESQAYTFVETWTLTEESHKLRVEVDVGDEIKEADETNNKKEITVYKGEPDLTVIDLISPADNYVTGDDTPDFEFMVSSGSGDYYVCELFINDEVYGKIGLQDPDTDFSIGGEAVYRDSHGRLWTPTADQSYTWGPDKASGSCVGKGADYPACHYCDTLEYAGFSDWILPSCKSHTGDKNCLLYQFGVDACGGYPCFPTWDPNVPSGKHITYWTSEEESKDRAYYVGSEDGKVHAPLKLNSKYIRCVRNLGGGDFGAENNVPAVITVNRFLPDGIHSWHMRCTAKGEAYTSEVRKITVDTSYLESEFITLLSPRNGYVTKDDTPDFSFILHGNEGHYPCELFIDDVSYGTGSRVENNMPVAITANPPLQDGTHSWHIQCTTRGKAYNSEGREITVNSGYMKPEFPAVLPGLCYGAPIDITEKSGSTLTDYPVQLVLDTTSLISANKMRSDCGDIRFTDSEDSALLDYWLEGSCNDANTRFWVRVPVIPASSTKRIYMYYGNPSANSESKKIDTSTVVSPPPSFSIKEEVVNELCLSLPDLVVEDIRVFEGGVEATGPLIYRRTYTVKTVVRNTGSVDVVFPDSAKDGLIFYVGNNKQSALSYSELESILPGGSMEYEFGELQLTAVGECLLRVEVDAKGEIDEVCETNNYLGEGFEISSDPPTGKLIVSPSVGVEVGGTLTVTVTGEDDLGVEKLILKCNGKEFRNYECGGEESCSETWNIPVSYGKTEYCAQVVDSEDQVADTSPTCVTVTASLPKKFDWRDNEGDWMTPVKLQGECNSCWAHATVAAMEAVYNKEQGKRYLDIDLSEQYLISCSEDAGDCCWGWPYFALEYIRDHGIPTESSFPYGDAGCECYWEGDKCVCECNYKDPCSDHSCGESTASTSDMWKITSFTEINVNTFSNIKDHRDKIKYALIEYGPVVSLMDIWDWGSSEMGCGTEEINLNHVVAIVGYNNQGGGYWVVRNSMDGWNSYFKVKYEECGIEDEVYYLVGVKEP